MIESPEYIAATKFAYDAIDSANKALSLAIADSDKEGYIKAKESLSNAKDLLLIAELTHAINCGTIDTFNEYEYNFAVRHGLIRKFYQKKIVDSISESV